MHVFGELDEVTVAEVSTRPDRLTEQQKDLLSSTLRNRNTGLLHLHYAAHSGGSAVAHELREAFEAAGWVVASDHAEGLGAGILVRQAGATFSHFLAVVDIFTTAKIPIAQDNSPGLFLDGYVEVWVGLTGPA